MARHPILVIGASGQLARALARHRALDGHPIVCRGRPDADVTDAKAVRHLFEAMLPAAVVNTAAYTAVDKAESEPEAAHAVNVAGAAIIARACERIGAPLIHLSTDYVFDGKSTTPYREHDSVAPQSVYGASKAAGEDEIRANCVWHIILRTAWLYSHDSSSFVASMLRKASDLSRVRITNGEVPITNDEVRITNGEVRVANDEVCVVNGEVRIANEDVRVVNDQLGTPTWADDVATAIVTILYRLLSSPAAHPSGTYHLTSSGATTWFGFASEIFRLAAAAGRRVPRVSPITTAEYAAPARRPAYSVLDNAKIASAFDIRLPPWQDSLAACMAQWLAQSPQGKEKVA